ncbi:glycosyltransferase family 1 protein [Deinococcus cavernae]|uniref:Glycosyltransferase family 1 protein n=1 Tax=Deinococcus cavernae TaxID=2320857 RepID=A0A418V794_9DEIO|nr:glycosyltransferase family 4 protein [Deinococcus cavernae]RJF71962.1 glycosyltransferase family 1 protein [Deinococcus cavernae]
MRVLHLLKTSEGATWALRQMRELVDQGLDVHVALPSGGRHYAEYAEYGIKTHDALVDFSLKALPARMATLRQVVREVEPDLIHSHFVGTTLTMRLALRSIKIPRVFQVPGPLHLEHPIFRNMDVRSADQNDFWIGSCKKTLDYYRMSGVAENRMFLSYYGTDLETFVRRETGELRERTGIGSGTRIVGIVAYMYEPKRYLGQTRGLKGHEDLIDAVRIGIDQGYDVALVVVGGAWNGATEYEAAVQRYGEQRLGDRVHFLGFQKDVAALYPGFDIAVHPSHSENVGGAVESLLLRVPTVSSDVGGFPDVVRDGLTGWTSPPADPFRLWQAIQRTLDDPERTQRMTTAGHDLVRHLFDVRRTSKELAGYYQRILERHTR